MYKRLDLNVDEETMNIVENLSPIFGTSELFRRAIKTYALLLKEQHSGKKIFIEGSHRTEMTLVEG